MINLFENPIAANIDGVAGPGDHQGRRDAEPGREPRRRGRPEPPVQPRRAGLERADRRVAADLPAGGRGLPAALEPDGRRRVRLARQRGRRRHGPLLPAQLQRGGHRGHGLAEVHGRLDLRDAVRRRRRRRRRPRGDDAHARGLQLHVGHRPPGLRNQRRVVDLSPRRVEHRRLRDRLAPARHPHEPALQPDRRARRDARVDGSRRRLAVRPGRQLPDHRLQPADRAPERRHGHRRLRRDGVRGPDPEQAGHQHSTASTATSPSCTRTTRATGATLPARRCHIRGRRARRQHNTPLVPAYQAVHRAEPGARAAARQLRRARRRCGSPAR